MRLHVRRATFAVVVAVTVMLPAAAVHAAPTVDGKAAPAQPATESAAEREFRAGVQAQLDGDMATARTKFEAALKIDPNFAPALIGMAGVAQSQGNSSQAEQFLQRAERAKPKGADVQLAWGRYYMRNRQPDRAEKAFLRARELAPRTIPPLLELGEVYIRTPGRTGDAVRMYQSAVEIDPNNPFAQYGLGIALAASGKRDAALVALERASQLTPRDPAALRAIGRMHMEAGELDKALAAFDRGLERQPKFVPVMLDRAEALVRLNRMDDAVTQIRAAEKLAPDSGEVQFRLGDVYQAARRWPEAEKAYRRAIALAPGNPLPYNNLAWMLVASNGDAKQAVELAAKGVELAPKASPLYDTLGWAQRAAGDLNAAQASLKRAIELEPKVANYHFHLGVVQRELKQNAAARASLQRGLELDSKSPQAEEARKVLKELPAQ